MARGAVESSIRIREALEHFEKHVRAALGPVPPPKDSGLVTLARIFYIRRIRERAAGDARRSAAQLLGRALYGSDGTWARPMCSPLGM